MESCGWKSFRGLHKDGMCLDWSDNADSAWSKRAVCAPNCFQSYCTSAFVSVVPSISTISVAYEWCDLV